MKTAPPYSPLTIANSFIRRFRENGYSINPLQVERLVYLSHGWYLAFYGMPFINYRVEAWKQGPSIPSLYYEMLPYKRSPIWKLLPIDADRDLQDESDPKTIPQTDEKSQQIVDFVITHYGHLPTPQLGALTQEPESLWYEIWHNDKDENKPWVEISNDRIYHHYRKLSRAWLEHRTEEEEETSSKNT